MDLASERIKQKKIETWYDRVFVKHLVKRIQDVDPDIGAIIYPETKIIVFLWRKIIVHKVILDEYNTEEKKIEQHVKEVEDRMRILKLGIIPVTSMRAIEKEASKLNIKRGRRLT